MAEITIELTETDRALLGSLRKAVSDLEKTISAASFVYRLDGAQEGEVPETKAADSQTEAQTEPDVKQADKAYKLADVQRMVIELCSPDRGLKAQVREIVKRYADKVTNVPEDKYAELIAELQQLESTASGSQA